MTLFAYLGELKWNGKVKISRYFKIKFMPLVVLFNSCYLVYCLLPLSLIQFIPLLLIAFIILKLFKMPILYEVMLVDPKDCSALLMRRFNQEMANFCWLVNKFNFRCFSWLCILYLFLWLLEHYGAHSVSWGVLINLMIGYAGATKTTKSWLKFKLGFYK